MQSYGVTSGGSQRPADGMQVLTLPDGVKKTLNYVGNLNGEPMYTLTEAGSDHPVAAAPPAISSSSRQLFSTNTNSLLKRRRRRQRGDPTYVKKPLNAFMVFMREQRLNVDPDLLSRGSAAVNSVLGHRWKSMTPKEQAEYYQKAEKERELHYQQHPDWTGKDNYRQKRRDRDRRRSPAIIEASAAGDGEKTQLTEPPCGENSLQEAAMAASTSQEGFVSIITTSPANQSEDTE